MLYELFIMADLGWVVIHEEGSQIRTMMYLLNLIKWDQNHKQWAAFEVMC